MTPPPQPDMAKVRAALRRYGPKFPLAKDYHTAPLGPSPVAQDAAIRKPLTSHGNPCRGFDHPHFLNNTD